jgi:hypothetical protein
LQPHKITSTIIHMQNHMVWLVASFKKLGRNTVELITCSVRVEKKNTCLIVRRVTISVQVGRKNTDKRSTSK